jgi:hypothetical protein
MRLGGSEPTIANAHASNDGPDRAQHTAWEGSSVARAGKGLEDQAKGCVRVRCIRSEGAKEGADKCSKCMCPNG